MKARLVRIGNSRGIRLPKPLIEEVGLEEEVELRIRDGAIVICASNTSRAGWEAAAKQMRARDQDLLLDPLVPSEFDAKEWEW